MWWCSAGVREIREAPEHFWSQDEMKAFTVCVAEEEKISSLYLTLTSPV